MANVNIEERLLQAGFEDLVYFDSIYDDALIGIAYNYRAVYDYEKMIKCLMKEGATEEEAMDNIDYNTIGVLPNDDNDYNAPIIIYSTDWLRI